MEAVRQNGLVLRFASAELKGDREVVIGSIKQNGDALEFASEELKGSKTDLAQIALLHGTLLSS